MCLKPVIPKNFSPGGTLMASAFLYYRIGKPKLMKFWKYFFTSLFHPVDFRLILILLGLFFLWLGIRAFGVYFADDRTVPVTGKVLLSKKQANDHPHRPRTTYHFRYEYQYKGKTYTSSRYHYKSEDGHSEAVARFRPGDEIQVFLNPENPEEVIVEKGWSWLNLIWILVSLAVLYKILTLHAAIVKEELNGSSCETT